MLSQLTFETFSTLADSKGRIAVYKEFAADKITPISALEALREEGSEIALLESAEIDATVGKYSLLGFDLAAELKCSQNRCLVKSSEGVEEIDSDPFEVLRSLMKKYRCRSDRTFPGFTGGCVGFLSYDAIRYIEKIPDRHPKTSSIPDLLFQFYDVNLIFDNLKKTLIITVVVSPEGDLSSIYQKAMERIDSIYHAIEQPSAPKKKKSPARLDDVTTDVEDEEYCRVVEEAKKNISEGEAFQIVLSRTFKRKITSDPFTIYRSLRMISPAPYMFYFEQKDFSLLGASPEKLVSLDSGILETIPIAGTRPRGETAAEDELLAKDLLQDEKETAEHMMLVDLGRNDLGKVAKAGTVQVKLLKEVKKFSHVMHIVSVVRGEIKESCDAIDALKACFPAGTLSGAPKIRAMQLIDELEKSKRGIYGGAICFIDNEGNLDSCIAIRMAAIEKNVAYVRVGAGIVFDSEPSSEEKETRHKAKNVLEAIRFAEEGVL